VNASYLDDSTVPPLGNSPASRLAFTPEMAARLSFQTAELIPFYERRCLDALVWKRLFLRL
jgi:hypothetical protein